MKNQTKTSVVIFGVVAAALFIAATNIEQTLALSPTVLRGASSFAPGIEKVSESDSQSANTFSPGALEKVVKGKLPGGGCIASINSPGHLFTQEPTTTDINP